MRLNTCTLLICIISFSCTKNESSTQPIVGGGRITASYKLVAVTARATSTDSTLKLLSITSNDVDSSGASDSWIFTYGTSIVPPKYYYFRAFYDSVHLDSFSTRPLTGIQFIAHTWMNSSEVIHITQDNGGRNFRLNNPSCTISASVSELLAPNSTTYWYVTYRSKANTNISTGFVIDANTGRIY